MAAPLNQCERVAVKTGLLPLLQGRTSLASAITRRMETLNARGFRLVTIIPDQWGFFRYVLNFLLLFVTFGLYSNKRGVLIIFERVG